MLSLNPPYFTTGNLVIFRDDQIDNCFYYACMLPRISRDKEGNPAILAYAILPESGSAANPENILEFGMNADIDLGLTELELEEARKEVQKQFGVNPKLFIPAPVHSGKVRFAMAQAGEEPDHDKWFVTSEVTPSLFGDNRASFAVRTSGPDAKKMLAATGQGAVSACVYYELNLTGITPVYEARMVAKMSTVYNRLKERSKTNYIFYTEEVEKLVEELHQEKAFEVEIRELDPDIKATALNSLLGELKKMVIAKFFEPAVLLTDTRSDSGNKGSGLLESIGGFFKSLIPGKQVFKSTLDIREDDVFTIDLHQNSVKTIPFCASGSLQHLIDAAGIDMSEKIVWVKEDDLPFFSQPVSIRIAADTFTSSNIVDLHVSCRVIDLDTGEEAMGETSRSFSEKQEDTAWDLNFTRQKGHSYGYEYRAEMFMKTDSNLLPATLDTGWKRSSNSFLYINPAEHYKSFNLDLVLNDLTVFDVANSILADVNVVNDESGEVVFQKQFLLSKNDYSHKQLSVVTDRALKLKYKVGLTYDVIGAPEHPRVVEGEGEGFFIIPNPFENRWSVDLFCSVDWEKYPMAYLDVRIPGMEGRQPTFDFASDRPRNRLNAAVDVDVPDRAFDYQVTLYSPQTGPVISGWHSHDGSPILHIDSASIRSERVYRFRISKPAEWKREGIGKVLVSFEYTDQDGTRIEPVTKTIDDPAKVLTFICPREVTPSYRLLLRDEMDGTLCMTGLLEASSDEIGIEVSKLISEYYA